MSETASEPSTPAAPTTTHLLRVIVGREIRTVARTRAFVLLGVALAAVLVGIAWTGGGLHAGYVPTVLDLLTPLELLVPVVAIAFGFGAILGDRRRGELDVLETYPLASWQFVAGVYLGRAIGLVVTITVPLVLVAIGVSIVESQPLTVYASHTGADSPILFARTIVLTVLFALAVLAVAIAISAVATARKSALALAVVALVTLLVGLDLALMYGFSVGIIGDSSLLYSLAISPLSAYRGLVFETAITVASGTGPQTASTAASLVGLGLWTVVSLAIATVAVER